MNLSKWMRFKRFSEFKKLQSSKIQACLAQANLA